jgi:4-amino-4-deoxy-L-arabinose transferase-like glycosyltransferase
MPDDERTSGAPHERARRPRRRPSGGVWEGFALLLVLALALGLRTLLLGVSPEWVGGAYSLDDLRKIAAGVQALPQSIDVRSLREYRVLLSPENDRALLAAGMEWVASRLAPTRQLSLLCGMAAVLLTWRIGRRLFSAPIGVLAAAVVALNPFQVVASSSIRMDAALESLVLACTLILWRALEWPGSLWFWAIYGAGAALLVRASPYTLLLLPAQALWVFRSRPLSQAIEHLGLAAGVALALYLPWAPPALMVHSTGVPWGPPVALDYVLTLAGTQMFGGYLLNSGSYDAIGSHLDPVSHVALLLPFLALMAAGAVLLGRIDKQARLLVGLSWVAPVVLVVLASVALGRVAAYPRQLIFVQPFGALLLAAGIVRVRQFATGIVRFRQAVATPPQADRA